MNKVQEIASEALLYLASTDELDATLFSEVQRLDHKIKETLGAHRLLADGTMAQKEDQARNTPEFKAVCAEHVKAILEHKEIKNKRATQTMRFEWARSMNANRRQGGSV